MSHHTVTDFVCTLIIGALIPIVIYLCLKFKSL